MPIYEYHCAACGQRFERWFASQGQAARTKVDCPICGSRRIRRLISAARLRSGADASENTDADDVSAQPKLFGRKEIAEITRQKQKQGLL
jgi:putative FmdB family regulatory protein